MKKLKYCIVITKEISDDRTYSTININEIGDKELKSYLFINLLSETDKEKLFKK